MATDDSIVINATGMKLTPRLLPFIIDMVIRYNRCRVKLVDLNNKELQSLYIWRDENGVTQVQESELQT